MSRLLRNVLIGLALLVIVVLMLLSLAMPWAAKQYLQELVHERGGELTIEQMRFNPFRSQLAIEDFRLVHDEQTPLQFDRLEIRVSLTDLLHRHIQINQLDIDGLQLTLTQDAEGWRLGNERLPPSSEAEPETEPAAPLEWTFGLTAATLQGATFLVEQPVQANQLHARRLHLSNLALDAATYSGRLELLGTVNDAPVSIDGEITSKDQVLDLYTDLVLNDFSLE